MQQIELINNFS